MVHVMELTIATASCEILTGMMAHCSPFAIWAACGSERIQVA